MKKGVLIGIIISVIIVMGIALAQVSQDEKSQISQDDKSPIAIPDSKRVPQSFTVGLSESMGVGDNP